MNPTSSIHLGPVDYGILVTYFAFVLGIGFALKRSMTGSKEFFLSGRSIPAWVTGLAFLSANLGAQEGLDWLEAVPKSKENTFERIRLGFGQSGLEAMELRDQFGQTTVIKFAGVERNPKIAPEVFRFTPPKGADVITD